MLDTPYGHSCDAVGNRAEKETPTESTFYTWDSQNRMTIAEPIAGPTTYVYDADNLRQCSASAVWRIMTPFYRLVFRRANWLAAGGKSGLGYDLTVTSASHSRPPR